MKSNVIKCQKFLRNRFPAHLADKKFFQGQLLNIPKDVFYGNIIYMNHGRPFQNTWLFYQI